MTKLEHLCSQTQKSPAQCHQKGTGIPGPTGRDHFQMPGDLKQPLGSRELTFPDPGGLSLGWERANSTSREDEDKQTHPSCPGPTMVQRKLGPFMPLCNFTAISWILKWIFYMDKTKRRTEDNFHINKANSKLKNQAPRVTNCRAKIHWRSAFGFILSLGIWDELG